MLSDDEKKTIIILCILTPTTTVFLALRLAMRRRKNILGIDDWLLCFDLLLLYLQDVGALLLTFKGGEGKPMEALIPNQVTWLLKMFFWPEPGYATLIFTIKLSILISYERIFGRLKWFRVAIFTIAALTTIWYIGHFFSVIFQCTPIDKAWYPSKPGHCINSLAFFWGNSISNMILDYVILCLPIIPVWRLQMEAHQKLLILGSFALGSVACVASTLRAVTTGSVDFKDLSRSIFKAAIFTYIEPNAGVISACLPFLANVFGQGLLDLLAVISAFYSKTTLGLRVRMTTISRMKYTTTVSSATQRAAYEAYNLDESDGSFPGSKKRDGTTESVRHLV